MIIISPLSFCIVALFLVSNVVAPTRMSILHFYLSKTLILTSTLKLIPIRCSASNWELAAENAHSGAAEARRRAADHSASARNCAKKLQDSLNDNHDSGSLGKIYNIMDAHEANEKDQNKKARHHSKQAGIHRDNAKSDCFGDKGQRKAAKEKAEDSIEAADRGRKAAEESYGHTDTAIGFLKLGQKHVDQMKALGHKHPDYHAHHQGFQHCVDNAAMPDPSQRKLNKARKTLHDMTQVGVLGWE